MEKNLTEGSVPKRLLGFSLPYLLSYFLQTLYGMADLLIIGRYGTVSDTTAVSIGSQVMHMLTVMIVGLAMGTTVCVGRSVGGKRRDRAAGYIGNTAVLFVGVSLVLTALLLALVSQIVSVMSTPADAAAGARSYLTVCFIGIPFITAYNVISSIFRGMGDSRSPMYFIAVACAANIGLDLLFMGAFEMGPVGAALGTTLAQAVSVAVSLVMLLRRGGIRLSRADLRPQHSVIGDMLKIGVPIAVQDGLIQIAFILITVIANRRGMTDAAAVGIVEKIIGFLFLVPSSMLSSVSALGAQNIGADKPERARSTLGYAILFACGFGLCVAIAMQFGAERAVSLFTDRAAEDGAAVIRAGGQYLRGYVWDCVFAGIHFCFSGYFCAVGRSGLSFLHNIIAIGVMRVPGVYLMSQRFPDTLLPMGLATAAGSLVSVIICIIAYMCIRHGDRRSTNESYAGK